jgi:hypothetical protein
MAMNIAKSVTKSFRSQVDGFGLVPYRSAPAYR